MSGLAGLKRVLIVLLAGLCAACDFGNPTGGGTGGEGLSGVVVDVRGVAVAHEVVRLYPEGFVPSGNAGAAGPESTTTDGAGRYAFSEVRAGRYNLEVSRRVGDSVWSMFARGINLVSDMDRGADTLRLAGSLRFAVRNVLHLPVPGIKCFIAGSPWVGTSDADGLCVLQGVAPGAYRVSVSGPGVTVLTGTVAVASGSTTDAGDVYLTANRQDVTVLPGLYEMQSEELLFRLSLRDDGTYYQEVRMTDSAIGVIDRLLFQETGKYRSDKGKVLKRDILERYINGDFQSVTPWVVPDDGPLDTTSIRDITTTGFEILSGQGWTRWSRVSAAVQPVPAAVRLYSHPLLGFSMNLPDGWSARLDTVVSGTLYDAWMARPRAGGTSSLVAVYRSANDRPLPALMDSMATVFVSQYEAVILEKVNRVRGTTAVAELSYRMGAVDPTKSKLVMFQKGANVVVIHFIDALASFDANTDIQLMDASILLP